VRLAAEMAGTRSRREGAVATPAVAMPVGQVRVERQVVPARGEGAPVGERRGLAERRAQLRARGEDEAPFADGIGERVDAARKAR